MIRYKYIIAAMIVALQIGSVAQAAVCGDMGVSKPMTIPMRTSLGVSEEPLYSGSYALVVGSSNYTSWNSLPDVAFERDAIAEELVSQGFRVRKLCDPPALGDGGLSEIQRFVDQYGVGDNRLVIYLGGHGWAESDLRRGYYAAADSPPKGQDAIAFGFSSEQMQALAYRFKGRHMLIVVNSCYSATLFTRQGGESHASVTTIDLEDIAQSSRSFLTAGPRGVETPSPSAFAVAFLLGIAGYADLGTKDGMVRGSELAVWVKQQVAGSVRPTKPQSGFIPYPSNTPQGDDIALSSGDIVFRYTPDHKQAVLADIKPGGAHSLAAYQDLILLDNAAPAESASMLADKRYSVFYFEKSGDAGRVEQAVNSAGIPLFVKGSILPRGGATNGIACHPDAPVEVVRQTARALIEGGVPIRIIDQATKRVNERRYVLQALEFKRVGADRRPDLRPLTVADLDQLNSCPNDFVKRRN